MDTITDMITKIVAKTAVSSLLLRRDEVCRRLFKSIELSSGAFETFQEGAGCSTVIHIYQLEAQQQYPHRTLQSQIGSGGSHSSHPGLLAQPIDLDVMNVTHRPPALSVVTRTISCKMS
jgi:hypothetical protein